MNKAAIETAAKAVRTAKLAMFLSGATALIAFGTPMVTAAVLKKQRQDWPNDCHKGVEPCAHPMDDDEIIE